LVKFAPAGCLRGDVGAQVARVHREPLHHGQTEGEAAGKEGESRVRKRVRMRMRLQAKRVSQE
jgi:hypothetical protein